MTAPSAETLYFHCHACGIRLSVPASLAGVSGPCPNCAVDLVAPAFSERRRTSPTVLPPHTEKQKPERPQGNEFEKPQNTEPPVVRAQASAKEEAIPSDAKKQQAEPLESSKTVSAPLSSPVANATALPPRRSKAAQASPSLSEPLADDGRKDSLQNQTWVGGSGNVQLPPKKTVVEATPAPLKTTEVAVESENAVSQPSKTVLPEPKEPRPNIRFDSDENGRLVWRPPVESGRPSAGLLQLPEEYKHDAPRSRSRVILIALFFIFAAAGGLAYVFQDQWVQLWAAYKMRDQKKEMEPAAQVATGGKRNLPAPQELNADLSVAAADMESDNAASSTAQTDALPALSSIEPPQPKVEENRDLTALPSAVADAVVVQPKAEPTVPAAPPADPPASQPNESGVFIPRGTPSKHLIASGAPFAEADAWVMDAPEDRPPFTKSLVLPEFLNNPPAELEEPVNILRLFLLANSWEERLKYVLWPDKIRPLMQLYYQKHDDGPIEVQHADVLPREPESGEATQQVFLLGGRDMPQPVPIMVEKTATGWLVDWAIFVEGREKLLEKFFAAKGDISAPFRVFVRRKRYFGEDIPDLENKLCYEIQPPAQGFIGHAFADKNTPLAAVLDRYLGWQVLNAPMVMELRWKNDGEGGWMEIVGLAHENWRTPKMEPRLLK